MTRLQKKCFVASACLHGLLGVVVLVTAAFRSEPTVAGEQVLTLISPLVLDRTGSGGGPPAVVVQQPPVPTPTPTRQATPAAPAPPRLTAPPKPPTTPAPRQTARNPTPDKPATAPAARGHVVTPTFDPAPRSATAGIRQSCGGAFHGSGELGERRSHRRRDGHRGDGAGRGWRGGVCRLRHPGLQCLLSCLERPAGQL